MDKLRLIHNLPRSGGTIISKAISNQKNIVLLSEIHPNGLKIRNLMGVDKNLGDPLFQFMNWYDVFDEKIKKKTRDKNLNFLEKIEIINKKINSQDKILVIRDWAFVDFLGKPYIDPIFKKSLHEVLKKKFNLVTLNIVRSPLEIFLSCMRVIPKFAGNYSFNFFLECYKKFIKDLKKQNTISYENFCENPVKSLDKICKVLEIKCKKENNLYLNKINITGDDIAMNSTKIFKIKNNSTSILGEEQIQKINNNEEYKKIMKLLEKLQ